uniref:C3H1-type domain-containing protein n=1 Tax=Megaselia scalaris TaxID=36166 RepID=T1GKP8_MEGSC
MNVEDKKLDAPEEYDLEDGEIDDDDDEPSTCLNSKSESTDKNESSQNKDQKSSLVSIDLTANENTINKVANYNEREDECDDFADNLEKTMAAMLKKDGIVPKIPEIVLEKRKRIKEEEAMAAKESALSKNSRSSRRRKSRKAQKEKDREKELDKKRFKADENLAIEDDIDEDEMLGMRGASPTRKPDSSAYQLYPQYPSYVDSDYSKDCSYDSYDSSHDDEKPSKKKRNKKKSRWDKDRDDRKKKSRRNESSERSEDEQDKRNKDEPRKLELCKFYLQECCAKKDQCSYMHQEFPCKYYYLGMDCIYKDKCKYNHGEPLTDEFRNVLLKHIEMAPKEILGSFKRISRDNAINLLNKTHSKLCKQFGVQDTTAHSFKNNFKQDQMKHQVSQQLQHKKRQIQENNLSQSLPCTQAKIPSLLDLEHHLILFHHKKIWTCLRKMKTTTILNCPKELEEVDGVIIN